MNVLTKIFEKIEKSKAKHKQPLVVFDLDDTLIDCRYRKKFVLEEFCRSAKNRDIWPQECATLLSATLGDYEYKVSDFLSNISIESENFQQALEKYWLSKYFTNEYLAADEFFPNAIDVIEKIKSSGANVAYFTGRDEPGMKAGTLSKLREKGLSDHVTMKPSADMADDKYKIEYFDQLVGEQDLICFFENEIRNLNPFVDQYPGAMFVWLDTLYSPNQPKKHPRIHTMKDWNY